MKNILPAIGAFALLAACVSLSAVTATVTVTFDPGAGNPAGVEHYVEQKQGTNWVEKAKGAAAPLVFTAPNVTPGTPIVVRVKSRLPGVPGSDSAPTAEASAVVPLSAPTNIGIILTVQ